MKRGIILNNTTLKSVEFIEGETIEQKVARITQNREPITDGAPIIFTEKKDGVLPGYDIRTDRWDVALNAYDKIDKAEIAKREKMAKAAEESAAATSESE